MGVGGLAMGQTGLSPLHEEEKPWQVRESITYVSLLKSNDIIIYCSRPPLSDIADPIIQPRLNTCSI